MLAPTARLLELLELLQARPLTTGGEIAAALDVDPRTVRRYIEALQELGIPVEGQRGVGGGYRVRPGYRLPPLMLSEDEAVVVVLGLVAARRQGLDGEQGPVDGALTKIHRVLPDTLRRRVEALETTLAFTSAARSGAPVAGESVLLVADAIRRRRRIRTEYRTHAGERSRREVSPHGLVFHAGRWYLAAFDHLRDDLRTFRVDRMTGITLLREPADSAPDGFDAVEQVSGSLARVPWGQEVEVVLDLSLEEARRRIPSTLATLTETDEGTLLRMQVGSLAWTASLLAGLGCSFEIYSPDELRQHVSELAARLAALARAPRPSPARRRVSRP
ncbi:MAG TPA: YafY family protein [Gaiellaceae bacterium]|nr:YafY family protein [Gaiellaceae bacterium]